MHMESNRILFKMALGLQEPWGIEEISFNAEMRRLDIEIGYEKGETFACPICGQECELKDSREKIWRHLDFFQHECYLHAKVPRTICPKDGVHQVKVPWAAPKSGFTLLFESFAMLLVKEMTVQAAARLLRIYDTRLWRIVRRHVDSARAREDYSDVRKVGMDETSLRPHHNYISLFADLERNRVLFGTIGNSNEAIKDFVDDLADHGGEAERITDVSCDLWRGYEKGTKKFLSNAVVTYDRFHFIKKINEAMDAVRKAEGKKNKQLKGMRFLFLKNPGNLTDEERARLEPLRKDNSDLARAYNLKTSLQEVYRCPDYDTACSYLDEWAQWGQRSKLKPFVQLARSVRRNKLYIARWHISHISNGILEGINSIVQAAKNKARGFRNPHNFISICYLLAGKLDFYSHTI
jgi:transposase